MHQLALVEDLFAFSPVQRFGEIGLYIFLIWRRPSTCAGLLCIAGPTPIKIAPPLLVAPRFFIGHQYLDAIKKLGYTKHGHV